MRAILLFFFLYYFSPNKMLNLAECLWRQCLSDQNQNVGLKKKKRWGSTIHKLFHDTWKTQRWFRRFHLAFRGQKMKKQKTPGTSTSELGLVLLASSHPMVRHCDLPLWRRPQVFSMARVETRCFLRLFLPLGHLCCCLGLLFQKWQPWT